MEFEVVLPVRLEYDVVQCDVILYYVLVCCISTCSVLQYYVTQRNIVY